MTNSSESDADGVSDDELAFWGIAADAPRTFVAEEENTAQVYDLAARTARFGESVIRFAKKIPFNAINNRLIDQLVGAATSVGANYCEADDGVSRPDFKHRIGICRKEARETKFFLRMISSAEPALKSDARELWKEAHSLHLIFSRIWRSTTL